MTTSRLPTSAVAVPIARRDDAARAVEVRRSLSALMSAVEAAHPAGAVDALARELGSRLGAESVSLLIVDMEGRSLVRLARRGARALHVESAAHAGRIALEGTAASTALREQRLQVEPDATSDAVRVYAPVSQRGETVGVLELRLPTTPSAEVATFIAAAAHALAYVLIADRRHTDVYEVGQRSSTLSLDAEIQRRLLPPSYSCEGPQFALAGWQIPASSGGGDTFDYSVGQRTLSLSVTDAMGHGVAAAQLATLAVGSLRNSRRAGFGLVEQAQRASEALNEHAAPDQFVTALLVEIDLDTGDAALVNAGHVSPLLVRDGRVVEVGLRPGLVLDVLPDAAYQAHHLLLESGDRLVLLTDGMFEREAAAAEVATLLSDLSGMHPREAAQVLTRAVLDVASGAVRDDATVLVVDWHGPLSPTDHAQA